MTPKTVYLWLAVAGTILPYSQLLPWLWEHGLHLPLFLDELLSNRISTFFALDVTVSAVVLVRFLQVENSATRCGEGGFPFSRSSPSAFRWRSRCSCISAKSNWSRKPCTSMIPKHWPSCRRSIRNTKPRW